MTLTMKAPLVSVVMSVFNGQTFLRDAIDSILNQTMGDFEFLIIDDGSKDDTGTILSNYADRDPRIRIVQQENRGRAQSLNIGINFAQGQYIARMDADDIALPNRIIRQIDYLEKNDNVGVLGGAYELIDIDGQVLKLVRPPRHDSEIRALMVRYNPMCHPAIMMRKELVLACGGYRRAFLDADDYDLFLRMGERCELANLDKVVLKYRVHANQVSMQNMEHQTMCVLAARAAASLRRSRGVDLTSGVEVITPDLLARLGLSTVEIQQAIVDVYNYWIGTLGSSDPARALQVIDKLLGLPLSGSFRRRTFADARLRSANLHYRLGNRFKASVSAGRAVMLRPFIVGRPVKRLLRRLFVTVGKF
jgi:glycosyltransferase involved in cell wall biosynthesis